MPRIRRLLSLLLIGLHLFLSGCSSIPTTSGVPTVPPGTQGIGSTPLVVPSAGVSSPGSLSSPLTSPDPSANPGNGSATPTLRPRSSASPDSGSASPTPTPAPGTIPVNGVVILSGDQLDGSPMTVGESRKFVALAGDGQGKDISAQILWTDSEGKELGKGSELVYRASVVKMESLSARIPSAVGLAGMVSEFASFVTGNAAAEAKVSFTISTPDIVVAPRVKVLSDAVFEFLNFIDYDQGLLELKANAPLPTIRVGDVIVGAAQQVSPVKVLSISPQSDTLQLRFEYALPKEVIRQGQAEVDQTVTFKSAPTRIRSLSETIPRIQLSSGGCNFNNGFGCSASFPVIPAPNGSLIGDLNLRPTWPGFKDAGLRTSLGLSVNANVNFQLTPRVRGVVAFNEVDNPLSGIRDFGMEPTLSLSAGATLDFDGFAEVALTGKFPVTQPVVGVITFAIGPVPAWIQNTLNVEVQVDGGGQLSWTGGKLGFTYTGGQVGLAARYKANRDPAWTYENRNAAGTVDPVAEIGQLDLNGFVEASLVPTLTMKLWSLVGIEAGLQLYVRGTLSPRETQIQLLSPDAGTFRRSANLPLNSKVDGGLKLAVTTGIRWELGIAGLEPEACSLPSSFSSTNLNLGVLEASKGISESTNLAQTYDTGGPYGPLRAARTGDRTVQVHHIPAKASYLGVTTLTIYFGPAIVMDVNDHYSTDSYGNSTYTDTLKQLIKCCKFDEAFEKDILDVESKYPGKYTKSIIEMRSYAANLTADQKYPKGCPQNP